MPPERPSNQPWDDRSAAEILRSAPLDYAATDDQPAAFPAVELPPPGNARRLMLRALGADIRLSDFTAEERRLRWGIGP